MAVAYVEYALRSMHQVLRSKCGDYCLLSVCFVDKHRMLCRLIKDVVTWVAAIVRHAKQPFSWLRCQFCFFPSPPLFRNVRDWPHNRKCQFIIAARSQDDDGVETGSSQRWMSENVLVAPLKTKTILTAQKWVAFPSGDNVWVMSGHNFATAMDVLVPRATRLVDAGSSPDSVSIAVRTKVHLSPRRPQAWQGVQDLRMTS